MCASIKKLFSILHFCSIDTSSDSAGHDLFRERGANYFYHCTLKQGENTLEAQLTRVALKTMASTHGEKIRSFTR